MSAIPIVNPARVGILPDRLERACDLLRGWAEGGEVTASSLCVGRRGAMAPPRTFGVPDDALFLVASVTKPVTAASAVLLAERGRLTLSDRVTDYIPEFGQEGKGEVRLRHLLTHTSGLPDMLPENEALRAAHQPLSAFVAGTCRVPPQFPPETRVRYQSMGFAVLAEVVTRVAGVPFPEFVRREFFEPLGMVNTYLGVPPEQVGRVAPTMLPPEQEGTDWNWRSPYWLGLGAPWGGMITTTSDFARFARMMLDEGQVGKTRILGPATVRAMTMNQLDAMPLVPEEDRRCRPWALGWRLNWPAHSADFGDLLGPRSFGHWGATGALCWIDPEADAFCLLFTTRPTDANGRHLARVSNAVAAALA